MAQKKIKSDTQISSVPVTYNAQPTGWSSFTNNAAAYIKVGKMVTVWYTFNGTSNSTDAYFQLPSQPDFSIVPNVEAATGLSYNNGAVVAAGRAYTEGGLKRVTFRHSGGGGAWTASGSKQIRGIFQYIEQ